MGDLTASGTDPGSTYTISPVTDPGVYHEDRVVVTTVGGVSITQMFRVYGASFATGVWQFMGSVSTAYATVQNPDGSIHYLTYSGTTGWATSAWQGSGNNAVYNAVDYGMTTSDMSGATNTPALNAAIAALLEVGGGTLFIPAGTYYLNAPIVITPTSGPPAAAAIIAGVSGQTMLVQNSATDIFDLTDMQDEGVRFRDLYLSYASPVTPSSSMVAVNAVSCSAVTCERVYFNNCPTAFQTDLRCEFCGLIDCWIVYGLKNTAGNYVNNQTMVSLSGAEDFVAQCVLHQPPPSSTPNSYPTGCTGIVVASNTSSRFISNTHISDFAVGIQVSGGSNIADTSFNAVRINAYQNAVIIKPASEGDTIYTLHFSNCTFANVLNANTLGFPATSGVLITTNGGSNEAVSGVYFSNCTAYGWTNAGIEIDSGDNVVIVGGQYSSNGQNPSATYLGAGIAVASSANGADEVTISGVDCSGVNEFWQTSAAGTPVTQPYGVAIAGLVSDVNITGCHLPYNATGAVLVAPISSAVPTNVFIRDCNARAYSSYSAAMNVASAATNVQITNCAGYNDQGPTLVGPITPPLSTFSNTTWNYRGPLTFYVWGTGVTSVKVGSLSVAIPTGSFLLPCGVSALVTYTGSPSFGSVGM